MTTEELQAKRDALISAMATGVLRVRVGEIETVYQTTDEMRKALSTLNSEIATKATSSVGTRYSTTSFNRA